MVPLRTLFQMISVLELRFSLLGTKHIAWVEILIGAAGYVKGTGGG